MDDQLPNFDQGEDVLGEQPPRGPKKPKPRPTRKKPAKKAAKVVGPKRIIKKRRARRVRVKLPPTETTFHAATRKMPLLEFIETAVGIKMESWQKRILAAYLEKDK